MIKILCFEGKNMRKIKQSIRWNWVIRKRERNLLFMGINLLIKCRSAPLQSNTNGNSHSLGGFNVSSHCFMYNIKNPLLRCQNLYGSLFLMHEREQFLESIVINRRKMPGRDVIVCLNLIFHLLTFAPVEDVFVGSRASFRMSRNKGS